jgi:hypothetical protein
MTRPPVPRHWPDMTHSDPDRGGIDAALVRLLNPWIAPEPPQ